MKRRGYHMGVVMPKGMGAYPPVWNVLPGIVLLLGPSDEPKAEHRGAFIAGSEKPLRDLRLSVRVGRYGEAAKSVRFGAVKEAPLSGLEEVKL